MEVCSCFYDYLRHTTFFVNFSFFFSAVVFVMMEFNLFPLVLQALQRQKFPWNGNLKQMEKFTFF